MKKDVLVFSGLNPTEATVGKNLKLVYSLCNPAFCHENGWVVFVLRLSTVVALTFSKASYSRGTYEI